MNMKNQNHDHARGLRESGPVESSELLPGRVKSFRGARGRRMRRRKMVMRRGLEVEEKVVEEKKKFKDERKRLSVHGKGSERRNGWRGVWEIGDQIR